MIGKVTDYNVDYGVAPLQDNGLIDTTNKHNIIAPSQSAYSDCSAQKMLCDGELANSWIVDIVLIYKCKWSLYCSNEAKRAHLIRILPHIIAKLQTTQKSYTEHMPCCVNPVHSSEDMHVRCYGHNAAN